jgi:hypothetical protein
MSSFLADLADELVQYEATKHLKAGARLPTFKSGLASEDLRVLALIRQETTRLAALTAGVTSIANARARNPAARTATLPFAPRFSAYAGELLTRHAVTEAIFEVYQLWLAADSRLALARELSCTADGGAADVERPLVLQSDAIADAWCRACGSLVALLRGLAELMADHGVSLTPPHEGAVIRLLEQASSGLSPCIDHDGHLSLPGWAERRKEQRLATTLPVMIRLGSKRYPAVLRNLSSGGMEIATGFMVPTGTRLIVEWGGVRQYPGRICWCDGRVAGIGLDKPLSPGDPLWTASATKHPASNAPEGSLHQLSGTASTDLPPADLLQSEVAPEHCRGRR